MRARTSVRRVVDFMASLHEQDSTPAGTSNPCLSRGTQRVIKLVDVDDTERNVTMDGTDVESYDACKEIVDLVLAKDAVCAVPPCAVGGVYQPALGEAFPPGAGRVMLLSYFYDRIAPLLQVNGGDMAQPVATVGAIVEMARAMCMGRDEWLRRWGAHPSLMKELEDRPEYCLDLTFMYGLLRTGYEFDDDREVLFGKQIAGTELGWCLGAGIKLVGGVDVQCRV